MGDTNSGNQTEHLFGVDLGGTKIAAAIVAGSGSLIAERRIKTPRNDYEGTICAIRDLVDEIASTHSLSPSHPVGIGTPGSINPKTTLLQNANSTWLNDRPLLADLQDALQRPVRIANDANCFALSEALNGAGQGLKSLFGVIIGTGCGGGLVIDGKIVDGSRGIAGEWGHTPLPWAKPDESPGPSCWCGQNGCMETWVSGPALEADYYRHSGQHRSAEDIACLSNNDRHAQTAIDNHAKRLARGLAGIVNLFDPDAIILGGGLSAMDHLYEELPDLIAPFIFSHDKSVILKPPVFGDASGVRGAARLWSDGFDDR